MNRFRVMAPFVGLVVLLAAGNANASAQETAPGEAFPEGEELFMTRCLQCHTIGGGERVGSDLLGITRRRERQWLIDFIQNPPWFLENDPLGRQLAAEYEGMVMMPIDLSEEEIGKVLDYIAAHETEPDQPAEKTLTPAPETVPHPDEKMGLWLPGMTGAGVLLLIGALAWKFGALRTAQVMLVLAVGAAYWAGGGRRYHALPGNDRGYAPPQPVEFSHRLHAGELQISCNYCHSGVERSPVAGVPSVDVCMNCHRTVRQTQEQAEPSPEIAKIVAAWETRKTEKPRSIEWARVHDLPDFVRFDHRVHVTNEIQCQECHGPVERMDRVRQSASLTMGWCVDCHRQRKEEAPPYWKTVGASIDCSVCHY